MGGSSPYPERRSEANHREGPSGHGEEAPLCPEDGISGVVGEVIQGVEGGVAGWKSDQVVFWLGMSG